MRATSSIFVGAVVLFAFSMHGSPAAAQSISTRAFSTQGTVKVRYFDPFVSTRDFSSRSSRFDVSPFGFPAQSRYWDPFATSFSSDNATVSDESSAAVSEPVIAESSSVAETSLSPISSSSISSSPVIVAPVSGGITAGASSGRPWYRPPVRSPYRPPPRPPL